MTAEPGPDERRIRHWLRRRGVGPDALGDTMATNSGDWWDDLYRDDPVKPTEQPPAEAEAEGDADDTPPGPGWWQPHPGYYPRPHTPAIFTRTHQRADAALSPKTRGFLYNATAAAAGWGLGLYEQFAHAIADCGQHYSTGGALTLGTGASLLIAHLWDRRTRHWWPGIAWVARIPLATCLLALALWAPAAP